MNNMPEYAMPFDQIKQRAFITKVYGWMFLGLLLTGLTAVFTASSESLVQFIVYNRIVFLALIFAELGLVIYFSARIHKMTASSASMVFIFYSILSGLTLSVIFLVYTTASLASTFFITGGTFGIMSAYGYFTKRDLTSWGNILFMALIGLIIASLVNLFWHNPILYWVVTYAGVLIFVGLTAYDTQKIKKMGQELDSDSEEGRKASIMGALRLYLDFINLFLLLLRIFGRRR